ncbi:hypothetical protein [Abyssogena phaseoliformis symbiont]|uniref:hypothetical protein n=1 Tax=Abyssogena phaseoliformis symbiont TaxID=596095 RepID=UPI001CEC7E2F|nr:hypothetical protein [Abyssogena phaseoliformis symbiont]
MNTSDYQHSCEQMIKRLNTDKLAAYTLPAKAILKCTIHALEAKNAKIYYWVTFPTKLFAVLKRILPARIMDKILSKAGSGGKT